MIDVFEYADSLGLRVEYDDMGPRHGRITAGGKVFLNEAEPLLLQVVALAHECGHFCLMHTAATTRPQLMAQERAADVFAARLLITAEDYRHAERLYGHDIYLLAKELGVTPRLVEAWRSVNRGLSLRHARATMRAAI